MHNARWLLWHGERCWCLPSVLACKAETSGQQMLTLSSDFIHSDIQPDPQSTVTDTEAMLRSGLCQSQFCQLGGHQLKRCSAHEQLQACKSCRRPKHPSWLVQQACCQQDFPAVWIPLHAQRKLDTAMCSQTAPSSLDQACQKAKPGQPARTQLAGSCHGCSLQLCAAAKPCTLRAHQSIRTLHPKVGRRKGL